VNQSKNRSNETTLHVLPTWLLQWVWRKKRLISSEKKALWQMAGINRNAVGTSLLADRYGYSKDELKKILWECAKETRRNGNTKSLATCYDYKTSRFTNFEEWMAQHI
jgi:hypothetical protein